MIVVLAFLAHQLETHLNDPTESFAHPRWYFEIGSPVVQAGLDSCAGGRPSTLPASASNYLDDKPDFCLFIYYL